MTSSRHVSPGDVWTTPQGVHVAVSLAGGWLLTVVTATPGAPDHGIGQTSLTLGPAPDQDQFDTALANLADALTYAKARVADLQDAANILRRRGDLTCIICGDPLHYERTRDWHKCTPCDDADLYTHDKSGHWKHTCDSDCFQVWAEEVIAMGYGPDDPETQAAKAWLNRNDNNGYEERV